MLCVNGVKVKLFVTVKNKNLLKKTTIHLLHDKVLIWDEKALCNARLSGGHKCVILPISLAKC